MGYENARWARTQKRWKRENPPPNGETWTCIIGGASLTDNPMAYPYALPFTLDHDIPRSRDPKLRHELSNLHPMCAYHNGDKGSRSLEQYRASLGGKFSRCQF